MRGVYLRRFGRAAGAADACLRRHGGQGERQGRIHPDWCPGCGDFSVLAALQAALLELGLEPHQVCVVSGIGCSSNLPGFLNTYGMESGAWFHVDAAYGSALLLSRRHRDLLRGFDQADSISMDFHKNVWQAISCGAFLLRDSAQFRHLEVHADYLNPETHDELGIPNLVNKSLSTTRRFDALKLWLSFQVLGREKFGHAKSRLDVISAVMRIATV